MYKKVLFFLILVFLASSLPVFSRQNIEERQRLFKLAQSFEKIGEYKKAFEIFKMLYAGEPNNPNFSGGLERNMLNLKMFEELAAHYDGRLRDSKFNLNILGKLGEVYYQWGKAEKADSVWSSITETNPKRVVNYSFVANVLMRNRLYDRAVEVLLEGRRILGNDALFEYDLANLYFWKKEYIKGVDEYLKIFRKNEKTYSLIESRILGIFPDDDAVLEVIADLIREKLKNNKNNQLYRLLANLYFTNREYSSAFKEYINLDRILNAQGNEILIFANRVLNEKMYKNSIDGFEYIKVNFPDMKQITAACYGLAFSYEKAGSPAEDESRNNYIFFKGDSNYQEKNQYLLRAIGEYEEIIRKYSNTIWAMRAYLRIGEIKLNLTFDFDGAVESFTKIVNLSRDSMLTREAVLKTGDSMLAKGDLEQAENKYDEVIGMEQKNELYYRALYKKSFVNYLKENFSEAVEIANDILMQQSPKSKIYNEVLELLFFIEENEKKDENALHEYVRAEMLIHQRKYSEAIILLEQIKEVYTENQISNYALFMAGRLKGLIGDYEGGVISFKELTAEYPSGILADEALLRTGELYEVCIGDFALAEKEYEELLVKFPNSIYVDEARRRIRRFSNN